MTPWIKSQACGAEFPNIPKAHCVACRTSIPFRQSLFDRQRVESVAFACPIGYTAETAPRATVAQRGPLPGTELKGILKLIGIESKGGCNCDQLGNEMDTRGPQWCRDNIGMIVSKMGEEAAKRDLPFSAIATALLVRVAIRKSERNLAKVTLKNTL